MSSSTDPGEVKELHEDLMGLLWTPGTKHKKIIKIIRTILTNRTLFSIILKILKSFSDGTVAHCIFYCTLLLQ